MTNQAPVLFIHGLWLHASSWQPWADLFAGEGYQPLAPGWPGDSATVAETRENPESVAGHGRAAVVRATLAQYRHSEAVTEIIDFPDRGHSLTIDSGWAQVAATVLDWLRRQSL